MSKKTLINSGIFLLIVGPILALSFYSYFQVRESLTTATSLRRGEIASLASLLIKERLDGVIDVGLSFATNLPVTEAIEAGEWSAAALMLEELQEDFSSIDRISVFDAEGTLHAATHMTSEIQTIIGRNFAYRDYYQGLIRTKRPYAGEAIKPSVFLGYNLVPISIPVFSGSDSLVGFLLINLRLNTISDWISSLDTREWRRNQ